MVPLPPKPATAGVSRTLSGRHAPRTSAIARSGFVTPPSPTYGAGLMVTTLSEVQAYDDLAAHLHASVGGKAVAGDASPGPGHLGAIPERR